MFFKQTVDTIALPLTIIFNLSLQSGKLPNVWKEAIVVPIFKKGQRSNPENYRPVSLTTVACRIMEKIIHKKITHHLLINQLISDCQHGFISQRSTLTQQISFFNRLAQNQTRKQDCNAIYLDFTKAFDKISHNKLLHVLSHFKINNIVLTWIRNFLSNRTQKTVIEGTYSASCPVTSGVPQGSVLAPLLFVLYLESLLKELKDNCSNATNIFAFADDVKILSQDHDELRRALVTIEKWTQNWNLSLQPKKSEHISFLFSRPTTTDLSSYYIKNSLIPKTNTVKDLGITLSSNLKWAPYISKITSKANILSYNIIRSFISTDLSFYAALFKTHIRPILEYNTPIWNPHLITDIKQIEHIQRKYTRMVCQKN